MSVNFDLGSVSMQELLSLQKKINTRVAQVKNEVQTHHSDTFIQRVGLEILIGIHVVEAKTLGLHVKRKYPENIVIPAAMGEYSVLRGLDACNRPFIAIKVDLFDSTTKKQVTQVVEVVFKRYSLSGDGKNGNLHGNNYVTALNNTDGDGNSYQSGLYAGGGMSPDQMERVGKLLRGVKVNHQFIKRYFMKFAK